MKTKVISMTVAGVMAFQSVGFAAADRTAEIGSQAAVVAQQNMQQLKSQIATFDQTLAQAEQDIVNKEKSKSISNGFTVGAAALGLALGTLVVLSEKGKGIRLSTDATILSAAAAVILSGLSGVSGMFSVNKPTTANIDEAQAEIDRTQATLEQALANSQNPAQAELIARLNAEVKETKEALSAYKEDGSELSRNRGIARVAQFAGTIVAVMSVVTGNKLEGVAAKATGVTAILGGIAAAGGQIASIVTGLDSVNTESVLKEIRETRKAISTSLVGL